MIVDKYSKNFLIYLSYSTIFSKAEPPLLSIRLAASLNLIVLDFKHEQYVLVIILYCNFFKTITFSFQKTQDLLSTKTRPRLIIKKLEIEIISCASFGLTLSSSPLPSTNPNRGSISQHKSVFFGV